MVESNSLAEMFLKLEIKCVGFEDYVDATEESYIKTLDGFKRLVSAIQKESCFSANETIDEIDTDHLKLLMVPFYEAEVSFRVMSERPVKVKEAHRLYLEYLRLMNHYKMLEKLQKKAWKGLFKAFQSANSKSAVQAEEEEKEEDPAHKHPMVMLAS